jgi:hemerythrin superfamily protein
MKKFQKVKKSIVKHAKSEEGCISQIQRAIEAQTWSELQDVIMDNISWCNDKGILLPNGY